MRMVNPQRLICDLSQRFFTRRTRLAWLLAVLSLALASCASFDSPYQYTDRSARAERSAQYHRYSVMDDWFWRSRAFDGYYGAAYAGYGVWQDPWLMWTLRSGRYGGFGHWQFDPFYSPWRGIGSRFGWSGFGFGSGWGHGYPYFAYSNYGYRYRYPVRAVNGRGLSAAPYSTYGADRALLLLQQSERRNSPDYGGRSSSGFGSGFPSGSADLRSWPMQNQQNRANLQMETQRRGDQRGLPRMQQQDSGFQQDTSRSRTREASPRSEPSFEREHRHPQGESRQREQD